MILQPESGLTQDEYDSLKSATLAPKYSVVAHRYNLLFANLNYTGQATGFTGTEFDMAANAAGSTIFRAYGYSLEKLDVTTGVWSQLTNFIAPTAPIADTCAQLVYESGVLYTFAITEDGVERCSSSDEGATWGSWSVILALSATNVQSSNRLVGGTPSASSGTASRGFDGSWNSAAVCWQTPIGTTTGTLTYDRGASNTFAATSYTIYPDAVAYPVSTGIYVWDSRVGAMVPQIVNYAKNSPKNWTFQGSNNGTDWDTLDTQTNQLLWEVGGHGAGGYSYTFSNVTAYRYYRLNVTANQGGNRLGVGELRAFETVSGQQITHIAPVTGERIHTVYQDFDKLISNLRVLYWDGDSWETASSDIWWPFPIDSLDAVVYGDDDVLAIQSNIPGMYKFQTNDDNTVLAQVYSAGGLASFTYRNQSWSFHRMIDQLDALSDAHYFRNVRIHNINGTLWVTAYTSMGSSEYPIAGYRVYTSKDGKWWSLGRKLVAGSGSDGLALAQVGDWVYALEKSSVFRSYSTLQTGYSPTAMQQDITAYLRDYAISRGSTFQADFTLSNASGWLTNHVWLNKNNTIALVHNCGYYLPYEDEFLMEDEIQDLVAEIDWLPRTVQVGMTELDAIRLDRTVAINQKPGSARDRIAWMTDKYKSQNGFILDSQIVGPDDYTSKLDSNYGGLSHTATYAGSWKVTDEVLTPVNVGENIGFSTYGDRIWNGEVQVAYSFGQTTAGNWAGVVFRAVEASNLYSVMIDRSGALGLWQRVNGTWTQLASADMNDRVVDQTYYLKVRFYYSRVAVYVSDDGVNWNITTINEFLDYSTREVGTPYLYPIASTSFDLGFTGVYGKLSEASSIVRFSHFRVCDLSQPLVLEDAVRAFANLARIHDFDFDQLYTAATDNWTLDSGLTLTVSGCDITLTEDTFPSSPSAYTKDLCQNGTASASSTESPGDYGAENAFDDVFATSSWWQSDGNVPQWLEYDFPQPVAIKRYKIYTGSGIAHPRDWTLEYWDGDSWEVADTRIDIVAWGAGVNFDVSGNFTSDRWRIYVTDTANGIGPVVIAEMEMMSAARDYKAVQTQANLPSNHRLSFSKNTIAHGVILAYQDANNYYRVGTNEIGQPEVVRVEGGTPTTLFAIADMWGTELPTSAPIAVSFRQFAASSQGDEWWAVITLSASGVPALTYMDRLEGPLGSPLQFGFVLSDSASMTISDLTIPELSHPVPSLVLDPGEYPIAGLQRAIEDLHVRYFVRYDGSFRAWKPKQTTSALTVNEAKMTADSETFEPSVIKTHVRLIGAYVEADHVRDDLVEKYDDRFDEQNSSVLMTPQECYEEAQRAIQHLEEAAMSHDFRHAYMPLLEPEDHITLPSGERIVNGYDWQFVGPKVEQNANCREYIYGS